MPLLNKHYRSNKCFYSSRHPYSNKCPYSNKRPHSNKCPYFNKDPYSNKRPYFNKTPIPISAPIPVSAPTPISAPIPIRAPIPISLPVSISAPIPISFSILFQPYKTARAREHWDWLLKFIFLNFLLIPNYENRGQHLSLSTLMSAWVHSSFKRIIWSQNFVMIAGLIFLAWKDPGMSSMHISKSSWSFSKKHQNFVSNSVYQKRNEPCSNKLPGSNRHPPLGYQR